MVCLNVGGYAPCPLCNHLTPGLMGGLSSKQVQDVRALQEELGMVLKHQAREEGNLDLGTRSVSPPRAASPPHTLQNEAAMPGLHHRATSATHT